MRDRKFRSLPLHHIDSSIILEPRNTESGFYCRKYLNLAGYRYRGRVSFAVLGELLFKILRLENFGERYDFLENLITLFREKRLSFYSVPENGDLLTRIAEIDERIDKADRLILACAVEDDATFLVTLDSRLIGNQVLEKELDMKIRHPKDLI